MITINQSFYGFDKKGFVSRIRDRITEYYFNDSETIPYTLSGSPNCPLTQEVDRQLHSHMRFEEWSNKRHFNVIRNNCAATIAANFKFV